MTVFRNRISISFIDIFLRVINRLESHGLVRIHLLRIQRIAFRVFQYEIIFLTLKPVTTSQNLRRLQLGATGCFIGVRNLAILRVRSRYVQRPVTFIGNRHPHVHRAGVRYACWQFAHLFNRKVVSVTNIVLRVVKRLESYRAVFTDTLAIVDFAFTVLQRKGVTFVIKPRTTS